MPQKTPSPFPSVAFTEFRAAAEQFLADFKRAVDEARNGGQIDGKAFAERAEALCGGDTKRAYLLIANALAVIDGRAPTWRDHDRGA